MKKIIVYATGILILFLFLYWLNLSKPQDYIWNPTYDAFDQQPYGAYVLDKLLKTSWEKGYAHCYKSITDLKEEGSLDERNLLIIAQDFKTTESDIETLLGYIREGGTALIAACTFGEYLRERLKAWVKYDFYPSTMMVQMGIQQKYNTLRFCTPQLNHENYRVPAVMCPRFFISDSLEIIKDSVFVVAKSNDQNVIVFRCQIGNGSLLLSCNPLMYTNYGILSDSANMFIWNSFAYLEGKPLIRTEYYHWGSDAKRNQSPLRYLMSKQPLKWAVYFTMVIILIFMLFTAKRRQKAIPVVTPPKNKMMYFVRSVAGLYIRNNNNADIIMKKQIYWADHLKRNHGMDIINEKHDRAFFERLSAKTGIAVNELTDLFHYLDNIDKNTYISDKQMMEIITQINKII